MATLITLIISAASLTLIGFVVYAYRRVQRAMTREDVVRVQEQQRYDRITTTTQRAIQQKSREFYYELEQLRKGVRCP